MPAWNYDDELIERLARQETGDSASEDFELIKIGEQLETFSLSLRGSVRPDLYQEERGCKTAVDAVTALVRASDLDDTRICAPGDGVANTASLEPTQNGPREHGLLSRLGAGSRETAENGQPRIDRIGRYEIVGEIARGGMGVVYKAVDRELGRVAAIKLIRSGELADDEQIQRFKSEAQAAARLDHPAIVPVFEVGQEGHQHFMAMAFIDGPSLSQVLRESPLPPKRAAEVVRQVADAVQYAHEQGIVHRDLKPHNILLTREGQPKVADFGLAKRQESDSTLTETGQALGTPSFMPPEQAKGNNREVGAHSDVYSLGATLYCVLTGRPPFQAATQLETLQQVIGEEPVSPKSLNRAISVDLETICLKCLEKDPAKRYPTAGALASDLACFLRGEPIRARPVGRVEWLLKWIARKPMMAAAYGLAALASLLLVAGVTVSVFWRNAETARTEAETARLDAVQARQKTEIALQGETVAREGEAQARRELEVTKAYDKYVLNVRLAPKLWESCSVADARKALEDCPTHLRQWEWKLLQRRLNPELATMSGHTHRVFGVRLSSDETLLATWRNNIMLWDPATGDPIQSIADLPHVVRSLCFSPDGSRLYAGSDVSYEIGRSTKRDAILVWDCRLRKKIALLEQPAAVRALAVSPDGTRLAAGLSDGTLKLWNTTNLEEVPVSTKHRQSVERLMFLPKTGRLVSCNRGFEIKIWDVASGRELTSLKSPAAESLLAASPDGRELAAVTWNGHVNWWNVETGRQLASYSLETGGNDFDWVDFSPDQRRLAVRWDGDGNPHFRICDARTGAVQLRLTGLKGDARSVRFSPDNLCVACGTDLGDIGLWNTADGRLLRTLRGHAAPVTQLTFNRDATRLYSGDMLGTAKLWDLTIPPEVLTFPGMKQTLLPAVSPNGSLVACVADRILVRNATTGEELTERVDHSGPITQLEFHPRNPVLASVGADGTIRLSDLSGGVPPVVLRGHIGRVTQVEFRADQEQIASSGEDGTIKIWDTLSGRELNSLRGHAKGVMNVTFDANGDRLASFGRDGTVRLWSVSDARELRKLDWGTRIEKGEFWRLKFTPDNRFLAAAVERHLKVWNVPSGESVSTIPASHTIVSLAFSPDSRTMAYGGYFSGTHIWDLASRAEVALAGKREYLLLQFSPDGTRLAGSGQDHHIRLWDTANWQEIATLEGHGLPPRALQFDRSGNTLSSVSFDGAARRWVAEESPAERSERLSAGPRHWRLEELKRSEEAKNGYAIAFHLGWLLLKMPEDESLKARYDEAIAKLKESGSATPPAPTSSASDAPSAASNPR